MENRTHPSRLELDTYLFAVAAGRAVEPAVASHLDGCVRCRERVDGMRAQDAAFLARWPYDPAEFGAIAGPVGRRRAWRWIAGAGGLSLAVAAAALLLVRAPGPPPTAEGIAGEPTSGVRSKGDQPVAIRVRRGESEFPLGDRPVRPGDVLAVRSFTSRRYLLAISAEASGAVAALLADERGHSLRLSGWGLELALGIELDESVEPERILFLLSDEPLAAADVVSLARARLGSLQGEPRRRLDLGMLEVAADQVSFFLDKERR